MLLELVPIGRIGKPHGTKGELKILLNKEYDGIIEDYLVNSPSIFVQLKGSKVPFQIRHIHFGNNIICHFKQVQSRKEAELLTGELLYLPKQELEEIIAQFPEEDVFEAPGILLGFQVEDKNYGILGTVREIRSLPQQECLVIDKGGKELLVPMVEAFVQKIQLKKKLVLTELPEGFLDIF